MPDNGYDSCCSLLSFTGPLPGTLNFVNLLSSFRNRILTKPVVRDRSGRPSTANHKASSSLSETPCSAKVFRKFWGITKRRDLLEDNPILYHISELNTLPHPCDPPLRGMEKVTSYC